jgi:hypothetical protein
MESHPYILVDRSILPPRFLLGDGDGNTGIAKPFSVIPCHIHSRTKEHYCVASFVCCVGKETCFIQLDDPEFHLRPFRAGIVRLYCLFSSGINRPAPPLDAIDQIANV